MLLSRHRMSRTSGVVMTLVGAILLAGCVTSSNEAESTLGTQQPTVATSAYSAPAASPGAMRPLQVASAKVSSDTYRIGPSDVLDISVFQVPDLTTSVQVADTGTINLPLLGEVPVAGKTAQEVERDLTAKLGAKYLQNPQVRVSVKEYNSQQVTVEGAVKKPGVIPLRGRTTLLQVIALADGFEETSDWTVLILRQSNGRRSAARFDVAALQKGGGDDPLLQSGDVIVAGSSAIKKGFNTIVKALPVAGLFAFL
jgi:polysaccharide export outer membrane protein